MHKDLGIDFANYDRQKIHRKVFAAVARVIYTESASPKKAKKLSSTYARTVWRTSVAEAGNIACAQRERKKRDIPHPCECAITNNIPESSMQSYTFHANFSRKTT